MFDMEGSAESLLRSSRNVRQRVAQCLNTCAILVAFANLTPFVFSLFPLKLLDPFWQLGLSASILTTSIPILISFLLAIAALGFTPNSEILLNRYNTIARLSATLALMLLLTIPLQIYSGLNALNSKTQTVLDEVKTLKAIARRIQATNNEQQLRLYVATLPNAPSLPPKFDFPFPQVKQMVLENIEGIINKALNDSRSQKASAMQTFILECTRNSIQCLILSTAFTVISAVGSGRYGLIAITVLALFRL